MRGFHKSKRVSWASDLNLCQVKLFLSDESPSQVGLGAQDQLQAKASWLLHSTGMGSDEILPPGFEGVNPANQHQINLSQVPIIKWSCPPRLLLDSTWQVVAGDESKEVVVLNQREMRVLEAVYPRPSSIPPNPTFPMETEDLLNDQRTPLIPITPIEDEDATPDLPSDTMSAFNIPISSDTPLLAPGILPPSHIPNPLVNERSAAGTVLGVEPHVLAAASAAFGGIMKSNEQANLIDHDLLIKILSNPKLIEKLVTDQGTASSMQNVPMPRSPAVALSDTPHVPINHTEIGALPSAATSSVPFYHQPNGIGVGNLPNPQHALHGPVSVSSQPPVGARPVKDISYYKSLIQQHGGERQEVPQQYGNRHNPQLGANQDTQNNLKSRDSKPKIMKPCLYYNSSRGCRHGANCSYQHDESYQPRGSNSIPDVQGAKRMKMDREITGT